MGRQYPIDALRAIYIVTRRGNDMLKRMAKSGRFASHLGDSIADLSSFRVRGRAKAASNLTVSNALKGDWERLGNDMRLAADKVVRREKAKG